MEEPLSMPFPRARLRCAALDEDDVDDDIWEEREGRKEDRKRERGRRRRRKDLGK